MAGQAMVVGGGIGGLTAGAALARTGWRVTVYERAAALEDVGAGIAVAPNGLRALDAVGAGDEIRALAAGAATGGVRRRDGTWLARTSMAAFRRRFGDVFAVPGRSELIAAVVRRLPPGALHLGASVRVVDPGGADRPAVVEVDGERRTTDLLVAADGLRSATRREHLAGDPGVRYTGSTAWRFVASDAPAVEAAETWAHGRMVGLLPMADGRVYGYAMAPAPEGARATGPDGEVGRLRELFGDWHRPIPELMASLRADQVLHNDVREIVRPLRTLHVGRTALVGDAAHPMTPNLGQGGGMALEDAVTLAATVAPAARDGSGLGAALRAYTAARAPRTAALVAASHRMLRLTRLTGPAAGARDLLMAPARLLSDDLMVKLFFGMSDWRAPQLPVAADGTRSAAGS